MDAADFKDFSKAMSDYIVEYMTNIRDRQVKKLLTNNIFYRYCKNKDRRDMNIRLMLYDRKYGCKNIQGA